MIGNALAVLRHIFVRFAAALVAAACLALAGCAGGGVEEEGTGSVTPTGFSVGVVQEVDDNALIVNGVSYERRAADVIDGFGQPMAADALRPGMWVEVRGELIEPDPAADGSRQQPSRGVAMSIRLSTAVRGTVVVIDGDRRAIQVLGTDVRVGVDTVLDGIDALTELRTGDRVEVHGLLGGPNAEVRATRVERIAPAASTRPFELRGPVRQLNRAARTMTVGQVPVSYEAAAVMLTGGITEGMVVRVAAATPPAPGQRWTVERLAADQALPANTRFAYLEGFVSRLAREPTTLTFELEGVPVDASTASNRYLVKNDGQRIAVFGAMIDGVLKATSVADARAGTVPVFGVEGKITSFTSISSFTVRGVRVDASAAVFEGTANPQYLVAGTKVKIRGTLNGQRLIARKVLLTEP